MDYKHIVKTIFEKGYYQLDSFYNYDTEEFDQLYNYSKNTIDVKNIDIIRNFSHIVYKLAVNDKVKDLLFNVARERKRNQPRISANMNLIKDENISISFARKGPTYNNAERAKDAYHYDDSYVNLVLTFQLPETAEGNGLFVYSNLKSRFGMGVIAKIISRLLGRISWLRIIFKPEFIPCKAGAITLFFGDTTLHGVHDCFEGAGYL